VLGLCVAARDTDYVQATLGGWDERGDCTVIAQAPRLSAAGAALVHGPAPHGEDFDNTFEGCPVHSGAVVVPAALAIAEQHRFGGMQTVLAIAAGIEIICRLGLVAQKAVHKAGFHPTAVLGTFAATATAGVAAGLPPAGFGKAVGAGGGAGRTRVHAGWAAQSGMRAAAFGRSGCVGPRTVFEGTHGFFPSFAPSIQAALAPWVG